MASLFKSLRLHAHPRASARIRAENFRQPSSASAQTNVSNKKALPYQVGCFAEPLYVLVKLLCFYRNFNAKNLPHRLHEIKLFLTCRTVSSREIRLSYPSLVA
jgi:hypothetical protein